MSPIISEQWAVWLFRVDDRGDIYIYYPNSFTFDSFSPQRLRSWGTHPWRRCTEDGLPLPLPVWTGPSGDRTSLPHDGIDGWSVVPMSMTDQISR